jgi:hypothetical protein
MLGTSVEKFSIANGFREWYWNKPDHGHYLITANGYIYSQSDAQLNG